MHPRNIYNKRVDFKKLAEEFPEFKDHTTLDLKGRVTLNFKNPAALRILSKTLLKKDFDLDLTFPPNTLVPTIPLRLNYILFIEDLLNLANINGHIKGLDIGTGSSCIYPLLAARKNKWEMLGTDINNESIQFAKHNITVNKLEHLIKVVQVSQESILNEVLGDDTSRYDFCMCNPPFFGDVNELCSQLKRKPSRPPPKNAFTAESHEVLTEGGEIEFISKIIEESHKYQNRIKIYTSMVGIKRNVKVLMKKLQELSDVKSSMKTEFQQGNTTRFGIAWTFVEGIALKSLSSTETEKVKIKPYMYEIKPFSASIQEVDEKLRKIFHKLQLKYTASRENDCVFYNIIAYVDTWSHNRRKRREIARNTSQTPQNSQEENVIEKCAESTGTGSKDMDSNIDKAVSLKRNHDDSPVGSVKKQKLEDPYSKFLECSIIVQIKNSKLTIKLGFVDGSGGKDASHQVLQYIKNHLTFT